MERYERQVTEVEAKPWLRSEQRRVIGDLETVLRNDVNALIEEARKAGLRDLDQEEGQLRRRAQSLGADDAEVRMQLARGARAQLLASQADRAMTQAAARAVFEEAKLTADADVILLTGLAAQKRHHEISAIDKGKDFSPLRDAALQFDDEFTAWRRANPSMVERLAEIQRQRDVEATLFDASAQHALDLYGIGREASAPQLRPLPAAEPSASGLQIGPAFSRAGLSGLAAGDPAARR
jgi:hypothetical protein